MSTGSFIEMFMTTFGWHLYEIVWGVISSTGLAYLPFFAVIIDNIIKPIESQEAKAAAVTSLRRLEIDIVRLIVMMMLAVSPYMTISYGAVSFTKACQGDTGTAGNSVNAGQSGTIFDNVFKPSLLNNQEAKAPPWFYIVMSVSGGINDAVISRLPCEINMRQAAYEMSSVNISDPHLKREVQRFITECHQPAIADFYNNRREFPNDMEMSDIDWPGSKYFNDNFYRSEFAKHPTPGFAFDLLRESDKAYYTENQGGQQARPEYGYPSCHEWWNDPSVGLRAGLIDEVPDSLRSWLADSWVGQKVGAKTDADNAAIRAVLKNEGANIYDGLDISGNGLRSDAESTTITEGIYKGAGEVIGTLGAWVFEALLQPILFGVKEAAPYAQATMLMATYFLLPWVLLVGNYSWSTIKTATVTIFAIKFWTSIWAVIDLLDNKLGQTLSQASGNKGVWGFFSASNQLMYSIVDITILALYMGLPFYFLTILGWGGERGAAAPTQSTTGVANEAKSGGSVGVEMAKSGVTKN